MPVLDLACRQGITGVEQLVRADGRAVRIAQAGAGDLSGGRLSACAICSGPRQVLPWASRGADIMQSGRARGEAYFRLESEESLSVLLDHLPGFRMAERNRLLALLLEIWYDHPFELKESNWSPGERPAFRRNRRAQRIHTGGDARPRRSHTCSAARGGTPVVRRFRARCAGGGVSRGLASSCPPSGPVAWAPLFERYGDDVLRFQLLFDACEDLRVDWRVQGVGAELSEPSARLRRIAPTAAAGSVAVL
jgi:hypothetical protein